MLGLELVEFFCAHHRVERLDLPAARLVDDVAQVGEVFLQHVERAQAVECLHRVIAVADPAVAIVPIALAVGRFGDRCRQRGHDRAGFLVLAQLERDRRADRLFLPFERNVQAPHPMLPVFRRIGFHPAHFAADIAHEGLVRAEKEMLVAFDPIMAPFENVANRRIGGQAQGLRPGKIADMVRAVGGRGKFLTVILHWCKHDLETRRTCHRAHDARKGDGAILPSGPLIARSEVADLYRATVFRLEPGLQDRTIALVMLAGADLPFELEAPGAAVFLVAIKQRAEHRIAIDPRNAAPDETALLVHQRADLAIADRGKFEICGHSSSSQLCTAVTLARR